MLQRHTIQSITIECRPWYVRKRTDSASGCLNRLGLGEIWMVAVFRLFTWHFADRKIRKYQRQSAADVLLLACHRLNWPVAPTPRD